MAIGRFRDAPAEMDEVEQRVAAAQYPEGGLVLGACTGVVAGALTAPTVLVVGPILGSVVGFLLGRRYRARALQSLRAEATASDEGRREREAADGGTSERGVGDDA